MYLYGASGHSKVVIDILNSINKPIDGIFDDNNQITTLLGIPVKPWNAKTMGALHELVISVGNNKIRKEIAASISAKYGAVIHPSAVISSNAFIGKGTVIMPNAVVNSSAKIGLHGIINSGAVVEHDCILEDYVHISPNATLAGNVMVGEGAHIGIGACVIQGVKIGKWATIGAGAAVIKDVPDGAVVVGVPGKIIKINSIEE
jgi:acetyltransferase EpsM